MTWNPEPDPVRAFRNALTPAARSHLHLDQTSIPTLIRACQQTSPSDLARAVSKGIGWHHPANAPALIAWRIRRAAGLLDDDNDPQQEEART